MSDLLAIALAMFVIVLALIGGWALYWLVRTAIALWTGRWE